MRLRFRIYCVKGTACGLLDISITILINSTYNYYAWGKLVSSSMGIEGSL